MSEYANSFDDLRGDIVGVLTSLKDMSAAQQKLDEAMAVEIDRLWKDNADLRDELHAVANRVETLTRAMMIDAGEVAEKMIAAKTLHVVNPYDHETDAS